MADSMYTKLSYGLARLRSESLGAVLVRGAGGWLIIGILGQGIALGVHIFLARVMGSEHYGIYVYVLAWLSVLVLVAKMGLDTTLLRFVAAYQAQEAWGALRGILWRSNQITLLTSLIVGGLGVIVTWRLQAWLGTELAHTLWLGWGVLPLLTLTGLRRAALRSLKRFVLAQLPESVLRPLFLATLVGLLSVGLAFPLNGPTAMGLNLLATFLSFLIGTYWLHRSLPEPVRASNPNFHNREWITVALPLFFIAGTNLVLKRTDTLMIGAFLGTTQAGIYAAASRLATLLLFGLQAVNAVVAPMISELYAQGRMQTLQRLVSLAAYGILAFSFPVSLGMIIWGKALLGLFGPEFAAGYMALVVLAAGQLVNALAGSVGFLMMMTGHQNEAARVLGGSALLNIVLNATLIPTFGIEGAALSTSLTTAVWNTVMFIYVQKRLRLNPTVFSIGRYRR